MEIIYSLNTIDDAVKQLILSAWKYKVFTFRGNLGAGKTTFIQAICKRLGIEQNVSSPTFSIINEYKTKVGESIYHIDLYRLNDEEEAVRAGVEECLYSESICFVEWPERALAMFPDNTVHLTFEILPDQKRKILYELA
jgi:tRNA threonylcarbamoyladenosine biosynthesis protein TsaE